MSEHVIAEVAEPLARIVLNRPAALNALDLPMFRAVEKALVGWRSDPRVAVVVVRGSGRAFAAGGDIRAVREALLRGDETYLRHLYAAEYGTDEVIAQYPKPYAALIDGICMGGGVGLAVHGTYRIVGEHAALAMPETGIGFFPDVGCTYIFPRLPHRVGWYLGLTGYRMDAADAVWCGLATHHVPSAQFDELERAFRDTPGELQTALERFAIPTGVAPLAAHVDAIERCFGTATLRSAIAALEAEEGAWAADTVRTLRRMSPTALVVTWALFARGATISLHDALRMEYHAAQRMLQLPDFREGVRAVVVDKDRNPRWSPGTLEEVDVDAIERMVEACANAH